MQRTSDSRKSPQSDTENHPIDPIHITSEAIEAGGVLAKISQSRLAHMAHKIFKPLENVAKGLSFVEDYKENLRKDHSHMASAAGAAAGFAARGAALVAAEAEAKVAVGLAATGVGIPIAAAAAMGAVYTLKHTDPTGKAVSKTVADAIDTAYQVITETEVPHSTLSLGAPDIVVLVPKNLLSKETKDQDVRPVMTEEKNEVIVVTTPPETKKLREPKVVDRKIENRTGEITKEEFHELLTQSGVALDKLNEITASLETTDINVSDIKRIQSQLAECKSQEDLLLGFGGLDKFAQTIAKVGFALQNRELILFAGGISAVAEIGTGLTTLGCFTPSASSTGLGAGIAGAGSVCAGVFGLAMAVMSYFMQEQDTDSLGEALQTLSRQIREMYVEVSDIKHMLFFGFKHLSELMLYVSKGLDFLSEQQRQTFELVRINFQFVRTALRDIQIENIVSHQKILSDLSYVIDKEESIELSRPKRAMKRYVDVIHYHIEQKDTDKATLTNELFKLRSRIKSLCEPEMNGAREYLRWKNNPRQSATFISNRLFHKDYALGFLAEVFEDFTKKTLKSYGVNKEHLFCMAWIKGVEDYLLLLSHPVFQNIDARTSLDEIKSQSDNVVNFMKAIKQSDVLKILKVQHQEYVDEFQQRVLLQISVKKSTRDAKEEKSAKQTIKEYFSSAELLLFDDILNKIDYVCLLVDRFAELGNDAHEELENRGTLLNKSFSFTTMATHAIGNYHDLIEPVAAISFDYRIPNYFYRNGFLENLGAHPIRIRGHEHLIYMSCGVIAPGSFTPAMGHTAGSVTFNLVCRNLATGRNTVIDFLDHQIPHHYKSHKTGDANWNWGSSHVVTLADKKPYFVFFTGGAGHVVMFDIIAGKSVPCDNSQPFSFSISLPKLRDRSYSSELTTACYTHVAFNRVLMIHQVHWRESNVSVQYHAFDLERRYRLEYKGINEIFLDKNFLKSPNQLFYQPISFDDRSTMTMVFGCLYPGDRTHLHIHSRKLYRGNLSLDNDWTIHEPKSIPIKALAIHQVRSEKIYNNLLIVSSVKSEEKEDKLVVIFGNYQGALDHFSCPLPPVNDIADWQTLRIAPFKMGRKNFAIATLLDPTYKTLVFFIDIQNKKIIRLSDGPTLNFRETSILDKYSSGLEMYQDHRLSRSRRATPGKFPVNAYSIHISEHNDMLTLHFSYADNPNGLTGTIELATYPLTPLLQFDLIIDTDLFPPKSPVNLLGTAINNVQATINSVRAIPKKKEVIVSTPSTSTPSAETKSISSTENYIDDLNSLYKSLGISYNHIINDLKNKNINLSDDLSAQLNIVRDTLQKFNKILTDKELTDIRSVISFLKNLALAFNMLNIHLKSITGYKYNLGKEVNFLIKQINKIIKQIEQPKLSEIPKGVPFTGFFTQDLGKFRKFLTELGVTHSSELEKTSKLHNLNAYLAPRGMCAYEIARDGNCFYGAVADQLNRIRKPKRRYTHAQLRKLTVDHIIDNIDFYRGFIQGNLDAFISNASMHGVWAENIIPHALARAMNCNIVIFNSDGSTPIIIKRGSFASHTTLYLGYEVGVHYNSLVCQVSADRTTIGDYIKKLIDPVSLDTFNQEEKAVIASRRINDG